MNKPAKIALVVASLGLAWPAASWMLGKQIENGLDTQYQQLAGLPYLKVVERKFARGVFHSTEVVSFELNGELLRELAKAGAEGADVAALQDAPADVPAAPVRFTMHSEITHGPLPGLTTVAAAVADSELVLDEAMQKELAVLFGDKKPLQLNTVYRFDGGGKATLSSPAFAATVAAADGGEQRVAWQGVTATVDFAKGMQRYTMRGDAPGLEIQDTASHLVLSGMQLEGDQQRIFDDEPLLYAGTQKFVIGELKFTGRGDADGDAQAESVQVKQLVYDIAMPSQGEFVDITAKLGAEVVQVGEKNYGPAHYDLSFSHLHARSVAQLSRAAMNMYSEASLQLAREGQSEAVLATLMDPALDLLAHNPEISIDRISFRSPHGEAMVSARVRSNGLQPEDLGNPLALIGKLEVTGQMSLPEPLLAELQGAGAESAQEAALSASILEGQLAGYAAQGLLLREQGFVKSMLEFKSGQLKVNGKVVNPFALAAPAQAYEEAEGLEPEAR
ncbi:YdgA family protein [Aromatoleum diolicum]|uniref:DUF945 family protein n=1 Tax=Aromatoleum diolicum TaxID=75796 RepID=A0ABX1Q7J0_9RHOO|nr:YdgA family protein [Aromatoleum diolicum]NMG74317.1 DUF945 family protein [Aromatoleum diolicum]